MKKFISILFLFFTAISAHAAGADGIYSCAVTLLGRTDQSYVAINSHTDGSAVYTIAAISESQTFYGYGVGTLTSTKFTGTTQFGSPFNLSINSITYAVSGTVSVLWYGAFVTSTVSCGKIF